MDHWLQSFPLKIFQSTLTFRNARSGRGHGLGNQRLSPFYDASFSGPVQLGALTRRANFHCEFGHERLRLVDHLNKLYRLSARTLGSPSSEGTSVVAALGWSAPTDIWSGLDGVLASSEDNYAPAAQTRL